MRWTVLSSDLLVLFPAALCFVFIYFSRRIGSGRGDGSVARDWLLAMILINPCLILIDHGHFQVCELAESPPCCCIVSASSIRTYDALQLIFSVQLH